MRTKILAMLMCFSMAVAAPEPSETPVYSSVEYENYIALAPDVNHAMLYPSYWQAKCPDGSEIMLSAEEIAAVNEKNREMLVTDSGYKYALEDIGETLEGDFVRELLSVYSTSEKYHNGEHASGQFWDGLLENSRMDEVPDTVKVRFGFTVEHADFRALPTMDFTGDHSNDRSYDRNARAECGPYLPVAVVHESRDGEWYYAICYSFAGWVKSESVALCSSKKDWLERQSPEEFLVVTGRELRLPCDPYAKSGDGLTLCMGTVLPLCSIKDAPKSFGDRMSYGAYIVKLPIRQEDGKIGDYYTLIPLSEDVYPGYMPFTRNNVLNQLFKRLGDRYGWAGMYMANDCSGMIREVYSCFGFSFPRNAAAQAAMTGLRHVDLSSCSADEKLKALEAAPAGSLVHFPGHIMVYLGMEKDIPYVISAAGSFATLDMPAGRTLEVNSVVVNSLTGVKRGNGMSWLDNVTDIVIFEN